MHIKTLLSTATLVSITLSKVSSRIPPVNGLLQIVNSYDPPTLTSPIEPAWLQNFSKGIDPKPCHSHNDYDQKIPLYQALFVGCVSVEADIYVRNTPEGKDLLVGHDKGSLNQARTLKTMYLTPLLEILDNQNIQRGNLSIGTLKGVYDDSPLTTFVLLVDFKSKSGQTWELLNDQLEELRRKKYLTYWTPDTGVVQRPLTIVVSGSASLQDVTENTIYRDIFLDAPLQSLASGQYNESNSYYASASIGNIGRWFEEMNWTQKDKMLKQIGQAREYGLKARYWKPQSWQRSQEWTHRHWNQFVGMGVGVLNIEDLVEFRDWWDGQECIGMDMCMQDAY